MPPVHVALPSTPAPTESESPIISMRLAGAEGGATRPPPPNPVRPLNVRRPPGDASVFRQMTISWLPFGSPDASATVDWPDARDRVLGAPPSTTMVTRLLPLALLTIMEIWVPVKPAWTLTPGHEYWSDPAAGPITVLPTTRTAGATELPPDPPPEPDKPPIPALLPAVPPVETTRPPAPVIPPVPELG